MKSLARLLALSPLVASLFAIGCSGSDPVSPGNTGNLPANADGPDTGADPIADAGKITPAAFVSNTPGVTVVDVGSPTTPDVVILSSNLLQSASGDQVYQQWLGEIQNNRTTPVCTVRIEASFKNKGGTEVSTFTSYAEGEPYGDEGEVTIGCIPPGKIGSFYANGFIPAMVPLASIATLDLKIAPYTVDGAAPNVDAPILTTKIAPVFSTEYGISGSIVGGARVISNIGADFYPRDSRGLVLGRLTSVDLESLYPGAAFAVSTSGIDTAFTEYRSFVSFIDQAAAARRFGASASPSPIERAALAVKTLRDETDARAARARLNAR